MSSRSGGRRGPRHVSQTQQFIQVEARGVRFLGFQARWVRVTLTFVCFLVIAGVVVFIAMR